MGLSAKMPLYAVAFVALSAVPSYANKVVLNAGTLSGQGTTPFTDTVQGPFKDYVTFSIGNVQANNNAVGVSITNQFTFISQGQSITGLSLNLYQGAFQNSQINGNGGGTFVASAPGVTIGFSNFAELDYKFTQAGDYYVQILANPGSSDPASYGGSFAYVVKPVPLPSTLPMLSGAILALGGVGHIVSRPLGGVGHIVSRRRSVRKLAV